MLSLVEYPLLEPSLLKYEGMDSDLGNRVLDECGNRKRDFWNLNVLLEMKKRQF